MAAAEKWVPVPDYEGCYEVSDKGSVRSLERDALMPHGALRHIKPRVMRQSPNQNGYPVVTLCRNGVSRRTLTHRIVLTAFRGPAPEGMVGCHNDGDRTNAVLENLRWDTPKANMADRIRHGTDRRTLTSKCIHGHLLESPNLVPSSLRRGHRQQCLACNRSRAVARKRRTAWTVQFADEHYARILKEAAA